MKRKALIISNPGEIGSENYCEGVKIDVENYKTFLTSPIGGGWNDDEIQCVERPLSIILNLKIQSMRDADYTLIVFCGHGYATDDDTIIELRKNEEYTVESLKRGAKKRTIILDCCRVIENISHSDEIENRYTLYESNSLNKDLARLYYDLALSQCLDGIVVTYACDLNETAGDDERFGGIYSYSLLKCAKEYSKKSNAEKCTSIVRVHNAAAIMTEHRSGGTQHPKIVKPRSAPYFPFVVHI